MAFRLHEALGTQNERYFVAATPPAHSLACLRIDDPVTAAAARLATGVGGLAPHRTGFAPAGRQTEFHDVIASSLPSDQPCLVAPCTDATEQHRPHKGSAHIMSVKQRKRRHQTQDQQDLVQVLRENIGQPCSASELKYRTSVPKHLVRGLLTGVSDIAISVGLFDSQRREVKGLRAPGFSDHCQGESCGTIRPIGQEGVP